MVLKLEKYKPHRIKGQKVIFYENLNFLGVQNYLIREKRKSIRWRPINFALDLKAGKTTQINQYTPLPKEKLPITKRRTVYTRSIQFKLFTFSSREINFFHKRLFTQISYIILFKTFAILVFTRYSQWENFLLNELIIYIFCILYIDLLIIFFRRW